jgi:MutS domain V
MASQLHPETFYRQRIEQLETALALLNKRKTVLAGARFAVLLLCLGGTWFCRPFGVGISFLFFAVTFAIFIYLVITDLKNKDAIANQQQLIAINRQEIEILHHRYTHLPDGASLQPADHIYANDLDIFGKASVYQYINRTTSQQGNIQLGNWLLNNAATATILQRQEAIQELMQQTAWRQQLQAYGTANQITTATQHKIEQWLQQQHPFISKLIWQVIRYILPAASITILVLYLVDIIATGWFNILLLLFLAISFGITKLVMPLHEHLNKIAAEAETLSSSAAWIETATFKSTLLKELQQQFYTHQQKASVTIIQLKKILNRLDYRFNPLVFIPLNTFLLWDLQQVLGLEKWKQTNRQSTGDWFHALATIEALSSLGNLAVNNPQWCFPELSNHDAVFMAKDLGHPLIEEQKRVTNDFATEGKEQINLITGSNMGGKSTFLRSVGVNIVLAGMGAPVCASQLTLSPVKVMSSMRVSDNLEESTSTFYAELKKLKQIIEAVNNNENVYLLLDEILRGTNSNDRHTGSKALIQQLIHHKAAGIVATHDLELTNLAETYQTNIHNYHFDVQVEDDELYFDYKLKRGICRSMNASLLMKKIGIEL